ncbi:N-formylglutamate amidohydrolase [Haliea sp. E1-2-M8]|uniref:N-formylglutamate amidohydrolase n=1 Tax=Haliea sp. E1-2-M8 TaxID=3064706 RepID=UPI0027166D68|nr:N-formylglutamate amidohydrolase [Haliea sp. E1-2-M8]MDO8862075.1 N-formylglutamate amidohydrolase [Haliea sp. E1-2-M8]
MNVFSCQTFSTTALVITCEHGGNRVPAPYRHLFHDSHELLQSHRGFDQGALVMAKTLARSFGAPLLTSTTSRLLVDLNRSVGHRNLHMEAIRALPAATRQQIVERYYIPYRSELERLVAEGVSQRTKVVHISCHSFVNNLDGEVRETDIGLLYDPKRKGEVALCASWKKSLKALSPGLVVRRNFPYEGRNDGLTTSLRKQFLPGVYLGIELELNQKNLLLPERQWAALRRSVICSLRRALSADCP